MAETPRFHTDDGTTPGGAFTTLEASAATGARRAAVAKAMSGSPLLR
jgi:hypothetical protein